MRTTKKWLRQMYYSGLERKVLAALAEGCTAEQVHARVDEVVRRYDGEPDMREAARRELGLLTDFRP